MVNAPYMQNNILVMYEQEVREAQCNLERAKREDRDIAAATKAYNEAQKYLQMQKESMRFCQELGERKAPVVTQH